MEFHNLFYRNDYAIAVRPKKEGITEMANGWRVVLPSSFVWFADPFAFEYRGSQWLFVERMNRWRQVGSIAVGEIREDGSVTKFKNIITEPFHLSYPNVFEYNGSVWMIPESGSNRDIRLYKATEFPFKWQFVKVLYHGANFVDTSFLITDKDNGTAIMNSYDWFKKKSYFFKFDLKKMEFNLLPDSPLMMNERCGGNGFEINGKFFRVLQDCSEQYGSRIILRNLDNLDFNQGNASDVSYAVIQPKHFSLDIDKPIDTCHTYNRSKKVEVIDFSYEKFNILGPIISIHNKFLLYKTMSKSKHLHSQFCV